MSEITSSAKDSDKDSVSSSSSSNSYLLPRPDHANGFSGVNASVSPSPSGNSATAPIFAADAPPKTQAAFVNKLYSMVEDESIQDLISWSLTGDVFSVTNPTEFSKSVLPQYFKHNNWQSFVRQLNMYGFHKVNDMFHANPSGDNQAWEFKHPEFKRGASDLLQNIKRKSSKPTSAQVTKVATTANENAIDDGDRDDRTDALAKDMRDVMERLKNLERAYHDLYSENIAAKNAQTRQQQIISSMASFLESMTRDIDERDPRASKRKHDADALQQEIIKLSADPAASHGHHPMSTFARSPYNNSYATSNHTLMLSPISNSSNGNQEQSVSNGNDSHSSGSGSDSVSTSNTGSLRYPPNQYAVLPPLNMPSSYNANDGSYILRRPSPEGIAHNPKGHDAFKFSKMTGGVVQTSTRHSIVPDSVYQSISPPAQSASVGKETSMGVSQRPQTQTQYRTSSVTMSFGKESSLLNPVNDPHMQNGASQHQQRKASPSQDSQDTAKRRKL